MTGIVTDWRTQASVTKSMLVHDLRRLGLVAGGVVLVHSSLRHLGNVVGGAETVVDALLESVGPGGTVLFPTLTGTERDGPQDPPVMDMRSTPCWTGRIPETARHRSIAVRSLHPTHSIAALGPAADRYASGHETGHTPCDKSSPYYRLITEDGFVLLLGDVSQESNTTLHCLEELAEVPYHLQPDVTDGVVVDANGKKHVVQNRLHLWEWGRDFLRVNAPLVADGGIQSGAVGQSISHLMPARRLADTILPIMQEDPLYLLSEHARTDFNSVSR